MRSFKNIFLLLLIFIPSTAYIDKDVHFEKGLTPGCVAPEIEINGAGKELLSTLRGQYVLVQFWATYDGTSRMNNLLLNNSVKKHFANRVSTVSLSFDDSKCIFDQTVRMDGAKPTLQCFVAEGENSKIYNDYNLSNGFANYLINPEGVIVAKNISPSQLEGLLN